MQTMYLLVDSELRTLEMPSPNTLVLPGIEWGHFDEVMTPAYWHSQVWQHHQLGTYKSLRLGTNLVEETAACLLGGFGMRAELGIAAFKRLRDQQLLSFGVKASELEAALSEPFVIFDREWKYRFPRQKARYLSGCLSRLGYFSEPSDDTELRDKLALLPGVGLKTASWIVRNHRSSDSVAIIDVHILRAGRKIGIFSDGLEPLKNYRTLEGCFLKFSAAIRSAASLLDGLMWDQMRWFTPALVENHR